MLQITAREALSEAVRYWEPRRILYNCVLLIVVIAVFCANLPPLCQSELRHLPGGNLKYRQVQT